LIFPPYIGGYHGYGSPRNRMRYFVLNEHRATVEVFDTQRWKWWMRFNARERVVARTDFGTVFRVTTVFMGKADGDDMGVFTTAVFVWYCPWPVQMLHDKTWHEAEQTHKENKQRVYIRYAAEREHGGYPLTEWPF